MASGTRAAREFLADVRGRSAAGDLSIIFNDVTTRWLFADQLGPHFLDEPDQPVLLIESRAAFGRRPVHRRRAHLVLSALRHRAAELGDQALFVQAAGYREALGRADSSCAAG